jgi:hypothetical protein
VKALVYSMRPNEKIFLADMYMIKDVIIYIVCGGFMSVRAFTGDAAGLLARIKTLIDQGHITTWEYDDVGDFTHSPTQWKNEAWLRPEKHSDKLRLRIIGPESGLSREVFAVYHGRFIEMLIAHVPEKFTQAVATANPANDEPALS